MLHIYSCKTDTIVATARTDAEAIKLAKQHWIQDGPTCWDTFICEHSKIIGDADGINRNSEPQAPYWERCGSAMTGREQ